MIKTVIRFKSNRVMVFDKRGEQMPKYQGQYEKVKQSILGDALPATIFALGFTGAGELLKVPREEW
ncbi:MAG: hypothetical protein IMY88_04815 [Chloroflexi bacterium]|nr:hypothetical protein [Chloroflexota bacterium]